MTREDLLHNCATYLQPYLKQDGEVDHRLVSERGGDRALNEVLAVEAIAAAADSKLSLRMRVPNLAAAMKHLCRAGEPAELSMAGRRLHHAL